MSYPAFDVLRPQFEAVIAAKDDLLARGLIRNIGWTFTVFPVEFGSGGVKADFSKAMTPKWKRLIRYWTRERPKRLSKSSSREG